MTTRHEFVKCIRKGVNEQRDRATWCGRSMSQFEFAFIDVTHAAISGDRKDRLVACPACVEAVILALRNGHDDLELTAAE